MDELKVFTGNAHPVLAESICKYLGMPVGKANIMEFSNENIFVRILENVRARDIFVVQPLASPVNKNIVELLIMLDALKRASSGRITAVIPYYAYGRTDKKDQPRVPITARLIADLLTTAGAKRVVTMDLHAPQIQGFFNIPVDELTAFKILTDYWQKKNLDNVVVVATDIGISKRARDIASKLHSPLAIIEKRRIGNNDTTETLNIIGDVKGRRAITVDDEIDTAGSLVNACNALLEKGAIEVYSCCTHPVFSGPAIERIKNSKVKEIVVTNTLPLDGKKKLDKITVLDTSELFGEAIKRIHTGQSLSSLFD
jgi:ribose-phosphate pyrophosphokinase